MSPKCRTPVLVYKYRKKGKTKWLNTGCLLSTNANYAITLLSTKIVLSVVRMFVLIATRLMVALTLDVSGIL
jgi:hypothetical protein